MKRIFLVGIVASLLMICFISCSNSGRETVRAGIDTGFNGNKGEIPVTIDTIDEIAEDDSFENAARYDEDLALVSLVIANQTSTKKKIKELFSLLGFDNIVCNKDYDSNSADSISYCIGHYKDGSYDQCPFLHGAG
ncbi:MAG: hypothetical protein IJT92_07670 [Spirochaetia bacterium]|nr:hypothetical protein [Spirochaetia bacterium]